MRRVVVAGSSCPVRSGPITPVVLSRAAAAGRFVWRLGDGETVWQQCGRWTMSNIVLWLRVCVSRLDCVRIWCQHMRTVLNIVRKRGYYVYLASDKRIIHMVQSNYAHIVPALSAHHFAGQQFPPRKFPCSAFKFRCVDVHYHSWIIRSEAWWRRSNWQSNCYSAGSPSWAAEMWCIMPLHSAEINKDNSLCPSDPTITCLYKAEEKKNRDKADYISGVFF